MTVHTCCWASVAVPQLALGLVVVAMVTMVVVAMVVVIWWW